MSHHDHSKAARGAGGVSAVATIPQFLEVLCLFDADTILATYPGSTDPTNPTGIDSQYVYMVTDVANALQGQGGGELNISANTGDEIRWRSDTASGGTDNTVIFYNFVSDGGSLISTPQANLEQVTVALPNPQAPLQPTSQTIQSYYWACNVNQPGTVTYHFQFGIYDSSSKAQGYYQWDPFITIKS